VLLKLLLVLHLELLLPPLLLLKLLLVLLLLVLHQLLLLHQLQLLLLLLLVLLLLLLVLRAAGTNSVLEGIPAATQSPRRGRRCGRARKVSAKARAAVRELNDYMTTFINFQVSL
jgi:membrane protein implicated in regulation of membrane protease activity